MERSHPRAPSSLAALRGGRRWRRDPAPSGYWPVYIWADGIYLKAGRKREKTAVLVMKPGPIEVQPGFEVG